MLFCFVMNLRPPRFTLFPYTTLFRSLHRNFTRRQVAIQNRVASNIGISQSTFSDIAGDPVLRSEERFSRNAETDLVCRLLLEKKKKNHHYHHASQASATMTAKHRKRT